jgi:hypothetical protein
MFCKVCFDASKSDYKTHNVRDSASNVVCPLLLNTKFRTCGYFGHTTKYCKLGSNTRSKAYVRPAVKVHVQVPVQVPVSVPVSVPLKRGAFACLEEDICEDADELLSPAGVEEMDFDKETIIWGVGFKSMIGKRWADVVGC